MMDTPIFTVENFTDPNLEAWQKMAACIGKGENETAHPNWCPRNFDFVLCWPPTPAATNARIPCFSELHGITYDTSYNASRWCDETGIWSNYSNYTLCRELTVPEVSELASHIYLVGYFFSLVALFFAVFIFIYYKDLRCLRNTVHTNLMFSYILADFTWILNYSLGVGLGISNPVVINLMMFYLHYFQLTNYFWMFVEGLYLYMLVVETFTRENIKLRGYLIIGWGVPAVFTLIWCIPSILYSTKAESEEKVVANDLDSRWIGENIYDWVYLAPAITVLVLNFIFLVRIMWVLITKLRSANNVETHQNRKASKALLVLIPLLGITYVLLIVGPKKGSTLHTLYESVRAALFSTQGFTVALFYCFLNTEVRNTVRHHFHTWNEARTLGRRYTFTKDLSPNVRAENLRLYSTRSNTKEGSKKKRNSSVSEATTMTTVGGSMRVSNGSVVRQLQDP